MLIRIIGNLFKKQKVILTFMIITSILTAIIGCFIFGIYTNYKIGLIQGESKSSAVNIMANDWNGQMTSRTDLLEFDTSDRN